MKEITITSKSPIRIGGKEMLSLINSMRNQYGEEALHRQPTSLNEFISNCNIIQNRDENHGMISLSLNYINKDDIPCTRDFPNFGLSVQSVSSLSLHDEDVFLNVEFTVKAGSQKWQRNEIAECAEIFSSGDCTIRIMLTLDEKTEWAGHSSIVELQDFSNDNIPIDNFFIIVK